MQPSQPLVSAIIPMYNRESLIAETIESVQAQSYSPIEIIVVDDGSTDRSAAAVKSFKNPDIHYYYQSNRGAGAARNTGISHAQGEYYAFLDSDDLWLPEKITLQIQAFAEDPSLDMVFTHVVQSHDGNLNSDLVQTSPTMPGLYSSTLLIKRASFDQVGLFTSDLKIGEFIEWYTRCKDLGLSSKILEDVLVKRRVHGSNLGIVERGSRNDYLKVIKASLDRRRGNPR